MASFDIVAAAAEIARAVLERDSEAQIRENSDPEVLAERLGIALPQRGLPPEQVVDKVKEVALATGSTADARFYNQLFAGHEPLAVLGDAVASLLNVSMYTWKVGGPQILIERALLRAMMGKVGFDPARGEGAFTPGGSLSNMAAMIAARNHAIEHARQAGLSARAQRLALYSSELDHYSIKKNAGMIGLGRDTIVTIATDDRGRMRPDALEEQITRDCSEGVLPVMINATSGTTVQGAFDPLNDIADVAQRHGVWMHVDAAFGGTMLMHPEHKRLLDGAHRAQSFTWDAHKMMGVPLICSVVLFPERGVLTRNFDESADYLFQADGDELNPGRMSIQCGRRNDALKLWAAWQHLGDEGWARRIDRQIALRDHAVSIIDADPGMTLVKQPQSVNVCFEIDGAPADEVCDLLDEAGRQKIGWATVDGKRIVRAVFLNPDLDNGAIDGLFEDLRWAAAQLAPARS